MTTSVSQDRRRRAARAVGALLVLFAVEAAVPWLLISLQLVPHGLPSWHQVGSTLEARDDGQLVVGVLAAGAWACWVLFTASVVSEVAGVAARRRVRLVPGLNWCQRPAAVLVTAVIAGLALGSANGGASATPLPSLPAPQSTSVDAGSLVCTPEESTSPAGVVVSDPVQVAPTYVVQRRDTLWAIAARYLGDPLRYAQIVELNPTAVGPDNAIRPGTVLVLPTDARNTTGAGATRPSAHDGAPAVEVQVAPGDNLSSLTASVAGGGRTWQDTWLVNRGRAEPAEERFTDPDLIKPGWSLTIPALAPAPGPGVPQLPAPTVNEPPAPPASSPSTPTTSPEPTVATPSGSAAPLSLPPSRAHDPGGTPAAGEADENGEASGVAFLAFSGAGAALGAASLVALTRHRRRQLRWRRPGHRLPTTPPDLRAAERSVRVSGSVALPDVVFLDVTLRRLAAATAAEPDGHLPDVISVCLSDDSLTLILADARSDAPAPWTSAEGGLRWQIARTDAEALTQAERDHQFAPYPMLVSIGYTEDGQTWLIDLERVGWLSITGDPARGRDLLRFMAAELAHNVWSEMLHVTLAGLGHDLGVMEPARLRCVDDPTDAIAELARTRETVVATERAEGVDLLYGRLRDIAGDVWAPCALIIDPSAMQDAGQVRDQLTVGTTAVERTATAVVCVEAPHSAGAAQDAGWSIDIGTDGTLRIPDLGLALIGHRLPADEAAQLAQLLASAAALPADGDSAEQALVEMAAADPPRTGDLLQASDGGRGDVRGAASGGATSADPTLDDDLADWRDYHCPRPKIALLGPVTVSAQGRLPDRNPREQWNAEVVAYLAVHPSGVSTERFASDLWPGDPAVHGKTKVRQAIAIVRTWLGVDPSTGQEYLPKGYSTGQGPMYRLQGALLDVDLFRRLRRRAGTGSPDGISDLWAALNLVSGEPLDLERRRRGGYGWLTDEPLDHELSAMIVDVAHEVAVHHLKVGEPDMAAAAAEVALVARTSSDVPLLDLVAACDAREDRAEADAYVRRILANHDAEVEEDLPPRTAAILFRRERGV